MSKTQTAQRCAVLFIHGHMGSMRQFEPVEALVAGDGVDTLRISLPGHDCAIGEFRRSKLRHWQSCVDAAAQSLSRSHERVVLVGHSMGGLLSICACANGIPNVAGIVAVALPLRIRLTREAIRVRLAVMSDAPETTQAASEARRLCGVSGIRPQNALSLLPNAIELLRAMNRAKRDLPSIKAPLTAMFASGDEIVSPRSAEMLRRLCPAAEVTILPDSTHFHYPEVSVQAIAASVLRALCAQEPLT